MLWPKRAFGQQSVRWLLRHDVCQPHEAQTPVGDDLQLARLSLEVAAGIGEGDHL